MFYVHNLVISLTEQVEAVPAMVSTDVLLEGRSFFRIGSVRNALRLLLDFVR